MSKTAIRVIKDSKYVGTVSREAVASAIRAVELEIATARRDSQTGLHRRGQQNSKKR